MKKLLSSPFFHFLILGGIIFLLYGFLNQSANHPEGYDIQITEDQLVQMAVNHQRNFGDLPDQSTLEKLIEGEIQAEIYYREALRLGLDQDDEIIRRRLKQKYEFLKDDEIVESSPSEDILLDFYNQNQKAYQTDQTYSFSHYYFNPDKRKNPKADANAFLKDPSLKHDAFHISSPISNQTIEQLRNTFGINFADSLESLTASQEMVLLPSGFGQHVVQVKSIKPAQLLLFEEVKTNVLRDYLGNVRFERNMTSYDELKKKYNISIASMQ